jgi:formamidopyrimidine-DNA glycosylase
VVGHTISGVSLVWAGIVRSPSAPDFSSRLIGQEITGVSRRGKYLILNLSGGEILIIHMKMSGSLLIKPAPAEPDKYTRAVIYLDGKTALHFRDPRKFGVMWLVKDEEAIVGKLGPEPLKVSFTPQLLAKRLSKRKAPIKALLCDQNFIAGIGNMYADEALFAAGIHPLRLGGSLSSNEIARLHHAIKQVLEAAISSKGASIVNYYRPDGELGTAHFNFRVAHRRNATCPECSMPIERITVRNRGTYLCPKCQPIKN